MEGGEKRLREDRPRLKSPTEKEAPRTADSVPITRQVSHPCFEKQRNALQAGGGWAVAEDWAEMKSQPCTYQLLAFDNFRGFSHPVFPFKIRESLTIF